MTDEYEFTQYAQGDGMVVEEYAYPALPRFKTPKRRWWHDDERYIKRVVKSRRRHGWYPYRQNWQWHWRHNSIDYQWYPWLTKEMTPAERKYLQSKVWMYQ